MSKRKSLKERPLINQKIREVRKELNLTQEEAAQKMGMKTDTFSKKERNGNITFKWAETFAIAVGADPAVFASVFNPPKNTDKFYFSSEKGEVFTVKAPTTFIDKIYGTPGNNLGDEKPEKKEAEDKNKLPFILTTTERSLVETFHYLSKSQRKEVMNFINEIKERGR